VSRIPNPGSGLVEKHTKVGTNHDYPPTRKPRTLYSAIRILSSKESQALDWMIPRPRTRRNWLPWLFRSSNSPEDTLQRVMRASTRQFFSFVDVARPVVSCQSLSQGNRKNTHPITPWAFSASVAPCRASQPLGVAIASKALVPQALPPNLPRL